MENTQMVAPVIYRQPHIDELVRRFRMFPRMTNLLHRRLGFMPIDGLKNVARENRDVTFTYVRVANGTSSHGVLAEIRRQDRRPALYEEFLGFIDRYPDQLRNRTIVVLGSVISDDRDGGVYAPFAWDSRLGRFLGLLSTDAPSCGHHHYLTVSI